MHCDEKRQKKLENVQKGQKHVAAQRQVATVAVDEPGGRWRHLAPRHSVVVDKRSHAQTEPQDESQHGRVRGADPLAGRRRLDGREKERGKKKKKRREKGNLT